MIDEQKRLEALYQLEILDTPREEHFDRVTKMAARIFGTNLACINMVDAHRFFIKSAPGVDANELPREPGLCDTTIVGRRVHIIEDTLQDADAQRNSLVNSPPHIRFYAGAPVVTDDNQAIGTLCLLHDAPKTFSENDANLLLELADYVMHQIQYRKWQQDEESRLTNLQRAQRLSSLGLLAGGIAHDFNNCLMGILGNASLAVDQLSKDQPARKTVENIVRAAEQAAGLTDQLLTYAGERTPKLELVSINTLVTDTTELIKSGVPCNVNITVSIRGDEQYILCDPTQLRQVVTNLITNAAEAYSGEPGDVEVIIDNVPEDRSVYLTVKDNGCGMDESTVNSLFDPFFSTKFAGRGLGMAIVHRILERHKADIYVQSTPGSGSSISVTIPSQPIQAGRQKDIQTTPGTVHNIKPQVVMVIEDDIQVREFLERAINRLGCKVLMAESGIRALDLIEQNEQVDAIMVDASMPAMNGEEVVAELRDRGKYYPTIVMSGHDITEVFKRFSGLEIDEFIQKPFRNSDLESVLSKIIKTEYLH